jgi:hypothetical protein
MPESRFFACSACAAVIPTEAERSEAQWRDLFCCRTEKARSLDYAALWAASLGMNQLAL